jgi:hypothetical protein
MRKYGWVKVLGVLLFSLALLPGSFTVNGQDKKTLSPEEEAKMKQEETARLAMEKAKDETKKKEYVTLSKLQTKVAEIIQKWAKETDFEKLGKEIADYASDFGVTATLDIRKRGMDNNGRSTGSEITLAMEGFEDTNGLYSLYRLPYIAVNSPLVERIANLEFKSVALNELVNQLLQNLSFILPENVKMEDKKVTCRLRNVKRVDVLYSILKAHDYSLYIGEVLYESGGRDYVPVTAYFPQNGGNSYYRLEDLFKFDDGSDEYRKYYKECDDRLKNIFGENGYQAVIHYQWIINNPDKISKYYIEKAKDRVEQFVSEQGESLIISIKPVTEKGAGEKK